ALIDGRRSWQPAQSFAHKWSCAERGRGHRSRGIDAILRQMIFSARQRDREHAAFAETAFDVDCAAVQLHQLANQSETDTRSFLRSSARHTHAMETFENFRQLFNWNADTR